MTYQKWDPSPYEETREDLLREAERLLEEAGGESAREDSSPPRSLLVFSLAAEWYAVDLANVKKVLRTAPLVPVPGASPEVLGLMNCQGEVLCVLDLRKILGIPWEPEGSSRTGGFIVVMHFGGKDAGILVDGVDDAWEVPVSEVMPPLESLEPSRSRFFLGRIEEASACWEEAYRILEGEVRFPRHSSETGFSTKALREYVAARILP